MKRGRKRFLVGTAVIAVLSLMGCFGTAKVSNQNIVDIYKNDIHTLHPEFKLVHVNDSISLVYFKINESELLYERKTLSDSFSAAAKIFCRVTFNYESPLVMDSVSTTINLQSATNNKQEYAVGSIPIKINRGNHYLLTINTADVNGKRNETTYIEANKSDFLGGQNFVVHDPSNGHIVFSNWFDTTARIAIQCMHPVNRLYVRFYRNKFPIATPPFSADDFTAPQLLVDSSFTIRTVTGMFYLTMKSAGVYHIMADSNDLAGLTLYRFDDSYPDVTEAYQLIAPLRYISSNEEYQRLTSAKNPKHEVDDFWLSAAGGNKDRARGLIRAYYGRIQDANRYFTSYQEGWKTDRGMIYLIFGPPNSIFRTSEGENWVYGEERNYMALTFNFSKLENPFSDNDYALERQANYRNLWYNAVDLWREGRVY